MKFRCLRTNYYLKKVWKQGDILNHNDDIQFCPECEGVNCLKCHGTGRLIPPYHFEQIDTVKEEKSPDIISPEQIEIEAIRAKIKELGSDYDRRWKLPRLKEALIKLTKENRKV